MIFHPRMQLVIGGHSGPWLACRISFVIQHFDKNLQKTRFLSDFIFRRQYCLNNLIAIRQNRQHYTYIITLLHVSCCINDIFVKSLAAQDYGLVTVLPRLFELVFIGTTDARVACSFVFTRLFSK